MSAWVDSLVLHYSGLHNGLDRCAGLDAQAEAGVSAIRTARENSWRSIAPEPSRSNTLNAFVTCRKRKNAGTQDRFSGGWIPSCCSLGGVSVNGFVLQLGFVRFASLALETLHVVLLALTAALSILLPAGCRPVCCMQITPII
jgi:hypothetical protein